MWRDATGGGRSSGGARSSLSLAWLVATGEESGWSAVSEESRGWRRFLRDSHVMGWKW
jgi:hypothetical protein